MPDSLGEVQEGMMQRGGCLCGAVRFETTSVLRDVIFCHCSQCRRQTGLYYAATSVPRSSLRIMGDTLRWYHASDVARRGFCGTCGSALFWERLEGDTVSVLAGAFDDPSVLRPGYHIFTRGRAEFYRIADDLPCYADRAPDPSKDP